MGSRDFGIRLAIITVIGGLWRLGYLFAVKFDDDLLLNDSLYYSIQAGRNSQGAWFREGLTEFPGAEHGPLTSLYLTLWSLVSDDIVAWQRFGMTLIGIATVAVVGLVGRRLAGPRAGLVAAAIAAVYPNLWINDSLVMSESLACLIVAVALLVALGFDRAPGLGRAAALGVLVGLGALTRSEIALYAVGFAALAWWRGAGHPRRALLPVIVLVGGDADRDAMDVVQRGSLRSPRPALDERRRHVDRRELRLDLLPRHRRVGHRLPHPDRVDAPSRSTRRCDRSCGATAPSTTRGTTRPGSRSWSPLGSVGSWTSTVWTLSSGWTGARRRPHGRCGPASSHGGSWPSLRSSGGWRSVGLATGPRSDRRPGGGWPCPLAAVLVTTIVFYGSHRIRAPAEPVVVVLAAVGVGRAVGSATRSLVTLSGASVIRPSAA